MEAIVILFEGSFPSEFVKDQVCVRLIHLIEENAELVPNSKIKVSSLGASEVAGALVARTIPLKEKEPVPLNGFQQNLQEYCKKVRNHVPFIEDKNAERILFFQQFLSIKDLQQDLQVITALIENKKLDRACVEILDTYNLRELRDYLRSVNQLLHLV